MLRKATETDLEQMVLIAQAARERMKAMGIDQWQKAGYPGREHFAADVASERGYVFECGGEIAAVCAVTFTGDISYQKIDGAWLTDGEYATVHRLAVAPAHLRQGVARQVFEAVCALAKERGMGSVRVDTHRDNKPMQAALTAAGFTYCGVIALCDGVEIGAERLGYERKLS